MFNPVTTHTKIHTVFMLQDARQSSESKILFFTRNNLLNKNSTKKSKQNYYKNKINYNMHYLHLS